MTKSYIKSIGSYLPERIVTNYDLSKIVDTNDEWILSRTGIGQRHIVKNNKGTSDIASFAAENAIKNAGIDRQTIELVIVATTTPDQTFPAVAVLVQDKLGLKNAAAFDIQAVCAGFVFALHLADSMIRAGTYQTILVIGAETMSKLVDWQDRGTCVLFGDGAGAAILQANQGGNKSCIIHSKIHSDGAYKDILKTDSGLSSEEKKVGVVRMVGREVFKHAVEKMAHSMVEVVEEAGFSMADIDFIVPHQANIRILRSIANNLQIPDEKLIITLNKHANTSSASIPLALDIVQHKFKRGDLILAAAIGGGLSWGAVLIRW